MKIDDLHIGEAEIARKHNIFHWLFLLITPLVVMVMLMLSPGKMFGNQQGGKAVAAKCAVKAGLR